MVTSPADAQRAVAAGADGVIAQGTESGGHRSAFAAGGNAARPEVGTLALVPQIVDALDGNVPVIASGGIMDGRGIAAALALGASGVSLGTRFLVARESGVAECYRRAHRRMPGGRHGRDRCPDRASGALDPQSLRGCRGRRTRGHARLG